MLYFILRGVIDINIISKEHKMHFTTGSVCQCKISLPTQVYMVVYEDLGYLRR